MEQLDNNEIFDDLKLAEEQTAYVSDAICNVIEKELSEVELEFSTIKFCQHEPKFIAIPGSSSRISRTLSKINLSRFTSASISAFDW